MRLQQLPMVSVSAIEGHATGGGAELSTATDFRIIASDAVVHFVQVRNGVSTGWGGGIRLTKLLGRRNALLLIGASKPVDAQAAIRIGLCDRIANNNATVTAAHDFLKEFAQWNHKSVRAVKSVVSTADMYGEGSLLRCAYHLHLAYCSCSRMAY
jgi:ethylmalonyl-CoA/methylmalonyl-CoA decarboxylase